VYNEFHKMNIKCLLWCTFSKSQNNKHRSTSTLYSIISSSSGRNGRQQNL